MAVMNKTKVNGRAAVKVQACRLSNALAPPPTSKTTANSEMMQAQKTRCMSGVSVLPPAATLSITKAPLSDEVTKNTTSNNRPIRLANAPKGRVSKS